MQSSTILLIQKMQLSNVTFNVISQEISRLEFCSRMSTGKQWTLGSLVNPGTDEGSTTVSGTEVIQKCRQEPKELSPFSDFSIHPNLLHLQRCSVKDCTDEVAKFRSHELGPPKKPSA